MINKQLYTLHCHTNFSDGADSAETMVLKAKEIGFEKIGISDHLIVHKNLKQSLSYPYMMSRSMSHIYNYDFKKILPLYQKHCENLRKLSKEANFKIMIGFEVDYFTYNGWLDEFDWFISQLDYDYLINGNHMLFDESGENMIELNDLLSIYDDKSIYNEYLSRHFKIIKEAMFTKKFKFLAHLDYARKLGDKICGTEMFLNEKKAIINYLSESKQSMELSTKGLRKIGDFYPSENLLNDAIEKNVSIIISDDAHCLNELGSNFEKAENLLSKYKMVKMLEV